MEKSKLQEGREATAEKLWTAEKEKLQKELDEKNKNVEELEKLLKEEKENSDKEKKKDIKDKKAIEDGK